MPSTTIKAKREIRLIEACMVGISQMAPRNEMGIPSETQNASRSRRNRVRIMKTRAKPHRAFLRSRSRRLSRTREKSAHIVSEIPSGIRFWASAM